MRGRGLLLVGGVCRVEGMVVVVDWLRGQLIRVVGVVVGMVVVRERRQVRGLPREHGPVTKNNIYFFISKRRVVPGQWKLVQFGIKI